MNSYYYLVLIILLIVAIAIFAILSYRKYRVLKKLENVRIGIASDLHDDIGAALSSISFYSEAARINLQSHETGKTLEILDRMGTTSRNTIEAMSDIVWMVNPKNDQLEKLFERLENFGKEIFVTRNITFLFYADERLSAIVLPVELRKNFYLICKEAMHNIAKYAAANTVEILIKKETGAIKVIVKDNGTGFDEKEIKKGNGLLNMRVRAQSHGSKLLIESIKSKGTVISFTVPYPHNW